MSTVQNTCPHCNATLSQELMESHFYTCAQCKKPFIYPHADFKETVVPYTETFSPIIVGSSGKAKSEYFKIKGCITLFHYNGIVNLYAILWQNGTYSYLIEKEGTYAVIDIIDDNPPANIRNAKLGKHIEVEKYGSLYCYSDCKPDCIALKGEGKVFFPRLNNSLFCSFYSQNQKAIYILFSKKSTYLLEGDFYKLEDLHLSDVRNAKAWHSLQKFPKPLNTVCLDCEKEIKLVSYYRAINVACENCGSIYKFNELGHLNRIQHLPLAKQITFKIGTIFTIEELEFILINYIVKQETSHKTNWTEYALYNPIKGIWFLNESEGHYNLVKPTRFYITKINKVYREIQKDNTTFLLYSKFKFKIKHAVGEFHKSLNIANSPSCEDYTAPPILLAYENSPHEINWFEGEYCAHSTVKSWLKEDVDLETKEGIAPNQPFSLNFDFTSLTRLSVIAVIAIIFIQISLSAFVTTSNPVYTNSFGQIDSVNTRTIITDQFNITENNCAVDFELHGNMNNSWLEAECTLVNETTGDQYYFTKALEYYFGFDGGESWSEGSMEESVTVNSVKKGRYHLNILLANNGTRSFNKLDIKIIENVPLYQNFLITLLCFIIFPVLIYYRRKIFDRKQWFNSNYSPYNYD
jgi:DNA-directed RNA polymerase subunit RPC12/RpoP